MTNKTLFKIVFECFKKNLDVSINSSLVTKQKLTTEIIDDVIPKSYNMNSYEFMLNFTYNVWSNLRDVLHIM